jgi:hypothetical protein
VIPAVFVLSVFTVVRLIGTGTQNMAVTRRIVRIRRYYRDLAREAASYIAGPLAPLSPLP